jgi:lipopolysaccharide/colanic/teichoic acid biosynthesis glycosyltransferase
MANRGNHFVVYLYQIFKRIFDVFFSMLALIILSPLLLTIAAAIKLNSAGPVFYKGTRVGLNGALFKMFKFRTMVINADKVGGSSTPEDDPRITSVGRFLRRFKFDELPQLFNVFSGKMSFVGPRPQVKWAVDLYTPKEKRILAVQPGITDYASLHFPNEGEILKGSTDPDKDYMEKIHPEKMRLSLEYIGRRSMSVDIGIIFKTFFAIVKREKPKR